MGGLLHLVQWGRGPSPPRSLLAVPNVKAHPLDELLEVEYYRVLETWVGDHSRSLKLVPFESLGTVSCSPCIVTMINFKLVVSLAVCEIFSVKEWRDFENQVRGRSRSSKMAPFDRPYATFYSSAIVNSSILYHFRVFLTLNNIVTLKIGVRGHLASLKWNWCHSKAWV